MAETGVETLDGPEAGHEAGHVGRCQGGYVAVMTALLLVPLMIMAAFAIDVGSWYSVGAKTQTAADAAALAAVARLPVFEDAVDAAFDEAAQNGFIDTDGHSEATFENPASYPQILVTLASNSEVQVVIKTQADALFGKVVLQDGIEVTRLARAEFVRPVPMGNPSSQLGGGQLMNPIDTASAFWLQAQGYCAQRANGARSYVGFVGDSEGCANTYRGPNDARLTSYTHGGDAVAGGNADQGYNFSWTASDSYLTTSWAATSPPPNDKWYQGNGIRDDYFVAIDLAPAVAAQTWRVQIYRPGTCIGSMENPFGGNNLLRSGTAGTMNTLTGPRIHTRLYEVDATAADRWDAVFVGNEIDDTYWELDDCDGDAGDGWYDIGTIGGATTIHGTPRAPGRYYLSYGTEPNYWEIWGNQFALRVVPLNSSTICVDESASGACPTIAAVDNLPIFISDKAEDPTVDLFAPGASVDLYLANITAEHAGKTLKIDLFDAGEGMSYFQILDPSGTPVDFSWSSSACDVTGFCTAPDLPGGRGSTTASGNNCSARPCLDVTGNKFQNNEAALEVDIPSLYACTSGCWWKVRYVPVGTASVHDATEWSITITGDPIRLTD